MQIEFRPISYSGPVKNNTRVKLLGLYACGVKSYKRDYAKIVFILEPLVKLLFCVLPNVQAVVGYYL